MHLTVGRWLLVLTILLLSACGGSHVQATNPTPTATTLSQFSAVSGSASIHLIVTGSNFVAGSQVLWNGAARVTNFESSTRISADIAAPDLAGPGSVPVAVSNPAPGGGNSSALTFIIYPAVAAGVLLSADPQSLARNATSNLPGGAVPASLVQDGVILNQIEVFFAFDATVSQVDDALASIGAGIVSMTKGSTAILAQVTPQASPAAIRQVAATLASKAGVVHAFAGLVAVSQQLPVTEPSSFQDKHLLPTRFPAAWNLKDLAARDCASHKVAIVVSDDFGPSPPAGFGEEVPGFLVADPVLLGTTNHGYHVTTTMAAKFDTESPTGANPLQECLDITGVQLADTDWLVIMQHLLQSFPASGQFIVNVSQGFPALCDVEIGPNGERRCTAVSAGALITALQRAELALYWKSQTQNLSNRFVVSTSAGNSRLVSGTDPDQLAAGIYPGFAMAHFNNPLAVATDSDPLFGFVDNSAFWSPLGEPDLPTLAASVADKANLGVLIVATDMDKVAGVNNVIVTGSTGQGADFSKLHYSDFAGTGPDVSAVGQDVTTLDGPLSGTSLTAPQVAGLASYLWLLSADLRSVQPASVTRQAILDNARQTPGGSVIDAYASVLSLDAADVLSPANSPIRAQLLDVTAPAGFDEADIELFLRHMFLLDQDGSISNLPLPATTPDYSRFDLNGDGFTTAAPMLEQFDLDRVGSRQYGAASYTDVTEDIEGTQTHFNEHALSDLQILCYYAYSPLFSASGNQDARKALLAGRCGLSVTPATATVTTSNSFTFAANSLNNDPVTWSSSCGTISSSDPTHGLFTAPATPGSCTITATSTVNPALLGTATVTVSPGDGTIGSESSVGVDLRGSDTTGGATLFDSVSLFAGTTSHNSQEPPLDFSFSGSYRPDNSLPPTDYAVHAVSSGPIVGNTSSQPASGSYGIVVSCSNSGTAKVDPNNPNGNPIAPKAISLRAGGSGTLNRCFEARIAIP